MKKIKLYLVFTCLFFSNTFTREFPQKYLNSTLEILKARGGKNIIEIGCMWGNINHPIDKIEPKCIGCLCGHSTIFWAQYSNAKIYSVDINADTCKLARKYCNAFNNIEIVNQDGIEFLKNFNKPIDLLYLDAWDVGTPNYAKNHAKAFNAAKSKFHSKTLILIDDTDIDHGGKGKLIIPEAIKEGFKIIFSGRQTLLSK